VILDQFGNGAFPWLRSVPGQTEKSDRPPGRSVLPPIADIVRLHAQVRSVPLPDSCAAAQDLEGPATIAKLVNIALL
jgi:hypothetical protein